MTRTISTGQLGAMGVYSDDNLDLKQARAALEAHHDGLEDVKARIRYFWLWAPSRAVLMDPSRLWLACPGWARPASGSPLPRANRKLSI